jgi:hypothetical protein
MKRKVICLPEHHTMKMCKENGSSMKIAVRTDRGVCRRRLCTYNQLWQDMHSSADWI